MAPGSQPPHLAQDAGLVGHSPPRVGETYRKVELSCDGNSGGISGDKVQVASAGPTSRIGYVAPLVVHPDAEPESVPKQDQMPAGTAAHIDDPHPFLYDVAQEVEFGVHEGLDLEGLRGRIQSPIQ